MKIIKTTNNNRIYRSSLGLLGGLLLVFTLGCERPEDELKPATYPDTAEIFIDGFSAGLEYAAFGDSKLTAFSVDEDVSFEGTIGTSSMRFDIPNVGDAEGAYAGGVFRDLGGRNLTGYNALTFYAKASKAGTVDLLGFGSDFGENKYTTSANIKLNTAWNKYVIPIPDPSKLVQEKGLFVIAEGPEDGDGYTIWLDVVKYEKLGTLAHPRPKILNGEDIEQSTFIGVGAVISGLSQTFNLANGTNQTVIAAPAYFEFNSSDTDVATVDENGNVSVVGQGTAKITGTLNGVEAAGSLTLISLGDFEPAPIPDRNAADVISVFSDAYENVPVDFYNGYFAPFQTTIGQNDLNFNGDNIIKYSELNFVATEFKNPTINATEMTHFHVDIQVENPIEAGDFIKIQLGDFGPDGAFDGGDDVSGVYEINTAPPLVSNEWISLDIKLSDFAGLTQRANLAQIFFITDGTADDLPGTITDILVDNMYFYKSEDGIVPPIPPTSAAPTPTEAAADVISIYSDSFTDVPNNGFNLYGAAGFEEVDLFGNKALKYTFVGGDNGNFQVIELGANQIDAAAAGMTNFRFDLYFPNEVSGATAFLMKLVNIGAATSEAVINVNSASNPAMSQGSWLQFDLPFTELESNGLAGSSNIQQLVIDLVTAGEVYIDNIYFYKPPSAGGSNIVNLTFDDAASISSWNKVADANSAEASIDWSSDGGVSGGAMQVTGTNPSDAAGKAYIFQLDATSLNFDGATDVQLTFDLKLAAPLVAAAVHLQTNIPGVGVTNNFDLQGQGLNETTYTSYSFDFNGVSPTADTFTIHFNFASGNVVGAGGSLLIDNIKLVKN
jgi:hypothetical protein